MPLKTTQTWNNKRARYQYVKTQLQKRWGVVQSVNKTECNELKILLAHILFTVEEVSVSKMILGKVENSVGWYISVLKYGDCI